MKINSGGNINYIYINYICMTHAHDREPVDLLRMTSERLSRFTNEMGDKQTCNIEMRHLYKRIYFNPGLGPPVTLLKRSQLVPPCNPERVKQKFHPGKLRNVFRSTSDSPVKTETVNFSKYLSDQPSRQIRQF